MRRKITSLDELMKQEKVYFNGKKMSKGFYQNWQLRYALNMIKRGLLEYVGDSNEQK